MGSENEVVTLFNRIGLSEKQAEEISRNKKVTKSLLEIIDESQIERTDEKKLALLHTLSVACKGAELEKREMITQGILDERLKTPLQVSEALKYIKENPDAANEGELNRRAGVGIEVKEEDVRKTIDDFVNEREDELKEKRYSYVPVLYSEVRKLPELKWAKQALFKPTIDEIVIKIIGPKDERDVAKKEKKKQAKKEEKKERPEKANEERSMFAEGFLGDLHKPGENPQKYPEVMQEHLKATGGKVFTRFPPEPNGYLHIGHSKAIMVNFGYAKYHNGNCYLRFDDTNPEAEEDVYFKSIENIISWLGFEPFKVTYSSDYFDRLYELAENLIEFERAYVCHCTAEEVKAQRGMKPDGTLGGDRFPCKHRSRPVEENLEEFRKMKDGNYKSGEVTLRMKQDLASPNPQMWDLVAYRVLNKPHPRTGSKWKIYPTYDFTHCLVDSFENISHSLCTTEFRLSRESYEWLCDQLHVYRPAQREYGRLNITGTVLSKRKIAKLLEEGIVRDWDDPRLYTLEAIRRRGVPPGAILSFINTLGVTTSTTNIQLIRLDSAIRNFLDQTTPRLMMVLDPLEVDIENLPEEYEEYLDIPYKPGDLKKFGVRKVPLTKKIFIERSDYRDQSSAEYFRWAPNQPVGLIKVPFNLLVKDVIKDKDGKVVKVIAHYENDPSKHKKPKTYIQWVPFRKGHFAPIKEVRIQNQLFKSENPLAHPEGFLNDLNPELETIYYGSVIESAFDEVYQKSPLNIEIDGSQFNIKEKGGVETVRFQALRIGYFNVDKDASKEGIILNRIVSLKEDSNKN